MQPPKLRHLIKMSQWVRNPPSKRRVQIWAVVLGICFAIAGIEWLFGWPEALTLPPRR